MMMLHTPFTSLCSSYTGQQGRAYLEEELGNRVTALGKPLLDGQDLHEIVAESDRQYGHG
jgi:hypothetical protein